MLVNHPEMERLREQIRQLFKISTDLELAFPGRKFTLDGHLVGSIGEVIAAYHYDLELMAIGSPKHDAVSKNGRLIQIKATQGKRTISLRSEPNFLIVLWINSAVGEVQEIYNGPGQSVWEKCYSLASTGTRSITITKLRHLNQEVVDDQRIRVIQPLT